MVYAVKEIFLTLQGEGAQAGRRAVFCRFAGCNLWTGREKDRAKAVCQFCDTDFVGTDGTLGGKYKSAAALADVIAENWGEKSAEHTSDLQSLMRISSAVFCLKKKTRKKKIIINEQT